MISNPSEIEQKLDQPGLIVQRLQADISLSKSGQLEITIHNHNPFPVRDIIVDAPDASGSERMRFDDPIDGNSYATFNMEVQITQGQVNNSTAIVVSARLAQ